MSRIPLTIAFVTLFGFVACGAYDLSPLTNGQCPSGEKPCNTNGVQSCVSTKDPKVGCARSSCFPCNLTNASATNCDQNGACTVAACNAGFSHCDLTKTGCETETGFDVKNCSACGTVCAIPNNALPACNNGVCGLGACLTHFANCDADPSNGCEVNTQTDSNHCGGCSTVCPANQRCVNSACVP